MIKYAFGTTFALRSDKRKKSRRGIKIKELITA
jgi:hypothetical protein